MSQRMQQFVLDPAMNPYNVVQPGKRPRITISPTLALKGGRPYLSCSVPGGDVQEQMQLQWLLNVVEFGMDLQEAVEAPKFESFQLHGSFGLHPIAPGLVSLDGRFTPDLASALAARGYEPVFWRGGVKGEHSGALTAIRIDHQAGTLEGAQGIPDFQWAGPRYGIAW
jgi:gamma-glutamyltranspeptidase/glutathione hydrolase